MMLARAADPVPPLLYLCLEDPWLLNAGGLIRNYWLIRALAERFAVDVITAGAAEGPVAPDFAARCASIRRFPAPSTARRIVRALAPGGTLFTSGGVSRAMRDGVARLLAEKEYAAIALDLNMIDALPPRCNIPLIYNGHNCETALLRRRASREGSALRRAVTAFDAMRLRPIEARVIEAATLIAACSREDVDDFAALHPGARDKSIVVPNGVDVASYAQAARGVPAPGRILVTGSFDWHPNRMGLRWFLRDVLAHLEPQLTAGTLHVRVAGRMNDALAAEIDAIPGASAAPNVPDMRDELASAEMVVAPILASSGTRLRILEAWAAGRPVVTTSHGAFGLPYADGVDLIVRDGERAFAEGVATLAADPELRRRIRAAGRRRADAFDWGNVAQALLEGCEARLPRPGQG
jgi:glycosyltransferase involved in cell wall biosynthesis